MYKYFRMTCSISFVLLICLLSGCATTARGPLFTNPIEPKDNMGIFYIFRTYAIVGAYPDPLVQIDDKPLVTLQSMGYSYAYLKPGVHKLVLQDNLNNFFETEFEIHSGQELFECLDGFTQSLSEVVSFKAKENLKKYRLDTPLNSQF